ncbi:sugar kinase [Pedobacter metabolipauper]|uniref:2-dehydro-3-deoxygluconokinase n=1 Tax=Pedobacter metabolipauper TaxID=425513 RepID=A0A4V3D1K9_9SPHI|nr:sugar kinase [Pedobacter metabolipauper]TDQ11613.1 2-dehydro-3-deoxygluconokinase [Pedobacter metabolipauper]
MQQKNSILVFGELLIRLSAASARLADNSNVLSVFTGGSEANVSASLAQWELPVTYLTAVPENVLVKTAVDELSGLGVDVSKIWYNGSRIGLYFLLSANGLSSGEVVYDRKFSSFSTLKPGTIDWDQVLEGHTWFHFTALTPALNEHTAALCLEAVTAAKRKGLTVSVDLNYRNRLWDYGVEPIHVMPQLAAQCDVIMGNIWAANKMLGTGVDPSLNRNTSVEAYIEHAAGSANEIFAKFPQCNHVANTFRFMDNPSHNLFYGTYHTRDDHYVSKIYETQEVIDRIGSGDAFMAGLIYGLVQHQSGQEIIDRATGSGYQKLFVKGDFGDGSF